MERKVIYFDHVNLGGSLYLEVVFFTWLFLKAFDTTPQFFLNFTS